MTVAKIAGRSRVRRSTASPRWLHLCNGLDPARDGGMVPSILGMTAGLAGQGGHVGIVTPTPSRLDRGSVHPSITLRGPEADLAAAVRGAEVVHLHGLWQGHTRRGAREARRSGVPYLIAAHGMAEPWALRHKALKKRIYTAVVEGKNLRRAACLHALSGPEVGHLRALAPDTPICLVPNGVDLAPFDDLPSRSALEAEHPELVGKFVVLFYGRLHAKKGLDLLASAMAAIAPSHPQVHILLVGRDDGALGPFLDQLGDLRSSVTTIGHVGGESARRVWAVADAFVLPSYSEGFSMAILEALACRLPCLVTRTCHFPELAAAGGAIEVEPTPEGVTEGFRMLVDIPEKARRELGRRGRELVEARYTWDRQTARLAEVYRWVTGGGAPPEAVVT